MMEGDPKSAEFRERGSIFKQMAEMKKKIQLVEGERKAIFEDCESEKQENKDKIKALKDEVKVLQVSKHNSQRYSQRSRYHTCARGGIKVNFRYRKGG